MDKCKTCDHWKSLAKTGEYDSDVAYASMICKPIDPDTYKPMERGFEVRMCRMPEIAYCEAPVESHWMAITDASEYYVAMATGENFGCINHSSGENRK